MTWSAKMQRDMRSVESGLMRADADFISQCDRPKRYASFVDQISKRKPVQSTADTRHQVKHLHQSCMVAKAFCRMFTWSLQAAYQAMVLAALTTSGQSSSCTTSLGVIQRRACCMNWASTLVLLAGSVSRSDRACKACLRCVVCSSASGNCM